jgi:hypothetical protein
MRGPVLVLAENRFQAIEHVRDHRPDLDPDTDVIWMGNGDPLHWIQRVQWDGADLDVELAETWCLQPNIYAIQQAVGAERRRRVTDARLAQARARVTPTDIRVFVEIATRFNRRNKYGRRSFRTRSWPKRPVPAKGVRR